MGQCAEQFQTDIVLIHRGNPVYANMLSRKDWLLAYENAIAGLFLKKEEHSEFLKTLQARKDRYTTPGHVTFFGQ